MSTERTRTFRRTELAESNERRNLRIEVIGGPDAGLSATVNGRCLLGRGDTVDVRLTDPTVSQFHGELTGTTGGTRVRDLGSHNGSYAKGVLVHDAVIAHGAELELGETTLRVEIADVHVAERSKATSFGGLVGVASSMRELF